MWQGAVGVAPVDGLVSPAYVVASPLSEVDSRYYSYLFRTHAYMNEVNKYSHGIVADRNRLYWDEFKQIPSLFPPSNEQKKIADFLDNHGRMVTRLARIKRRQIKLLRELKQAIINNAVTRGVNSEVKLKSSSIDWLGDIPEHWECKKLKRCANINPSKRDLFREFSPDDKVVFLPMEKISANVDVDDSEKRPIKEIKDVFTYFERNDVVVAKITPCFENGKGACLNNLESKLGFGTTEFIVLRAQKNIMLPQYLYLITRTSYFRLFGAEVMTGAAGQKRVLIDFIANFIIGIPNTTEQQAIIDHITQKTAIIDKNIAGMEKEIDLISEYRIRLISDVATGKIDVRHITVADFEEEGKDIDEINEDEMDNEEVADFEECEV
ncbi:restriction endonuclease subunit S [Paenibacillus sp. SI8]|uniref:restriction endonuclease subunit S n=1 Tax=unclassified Paenibacillus TaxID=185978 RepID=UPI003466E3CA